MQRRIRHRKEKKIKRLFIEKVDKGFSKLENCFEQMKIFSTQFNCSMRILKTLAEDLDGEGFSEIYATEKVFGINRVQFNKNLFCPICRGGGHFEEQVDIEEEFDGSCRCNCEGKSNDQFLKKTSREKSSNVRESNKTTTKEVKRETNLFKFDSERQGGVYSKGSNSSRLITKNPFAKKISEKQSGSYPSGMSNISKTDDDELVNDSEFERMKAKRLSSRRMTFGFGILDQKGFVKGVEKINNDYSFDENDDEVDGNNNKEGMTNLEEKLSEENKQIINQNILKSNPVLKSNNKLKKIVRRGTVETEDLYQSVSVDMSFDINLAKLEKEEKQGKL